MPIVGARERRYVAAMLLTLLACWSPEPFAAPAPAQVEASDVLEGTAGAIEPGGEAEDGAEVEQGGDEEPVLAAEPGPDDEPDAAAEVEDAPPAPPTDLAVEPWSGHTSGRPLTLVGDDGAVVLVIADEAVAVTVLMEGPERLKVRCDGCRPPLEGWLQRRAVVR